MQMKDQRGFTIVELLLVIALIVVVFAAAWDAFALGQNAWTRLQTKLEAERAVRLTNQIISYELNLASFLEIRQDANDWTDSEKETHDRMIFTDDNGVVIMREKADSGDTDRTVAAMQGGTLQVSFTKPLNTNDSNTPHAPIANTLKYTVTAFDQDNNAVYSLSSVVMLSNMLPDTGVPISDTSLYSQAKTSNYVAGDRILYRTRGEVFTPSTPDASPVGCY